MNVITASEAKQNFGEALARAQLGPLVIERHRKPVAVLAPPSWSRNEAPDERHSARAAQRLVEQARLMRHLQMGIDLLCAMPAQRRKRVEAARREVDRWEAAQLCSKEYIDRWRKWLELPVDQLVPRMCSDAEGWGAAMRQNSPFTAT